jgi:hypothetical protein
MNKLLLLVVLALSTNAIFAQTTSQTTSDPYGNGSTTTYSDGSSSRTTADPYGNGTTTTFSDGSSATTTADPYGNGSSTTYN